jgi:hypothetical protein
MSDHLQLMLDPVAAGFRRYDPRRPDFGEHREVELSSHDPGDGVTETVELEQPANCVRIAAEALLPKSVADQYFISQTIVLGKHPASAGLDAEQGKEFRRHEGRANVPLAVRRGHSGIPTLGGSHLIESVILFLPIEIVARRNLVPLRAHGRNCLPQRHDPIQVTE